jgi:regulator of sigma E protease
MMGLPTAVDQENATDSAVLTVTQVLDEGPAGDASLPTGAEIVQVTVDGEEVGATTPAAFQEITQATDGQPIVISYIFNGEVNEVSITPETGLIVLDPNRPAIGVALALVETVRMPVHIAVIEATKTTFRSIGAFTVGISSLISQSVQGTADFSEVAWPIGIVGLVGDAAEFGITSLLMFTAIISLNLAVINMLPFPALDGGRLVMVVIEAVTRRPINPIWIGRVNLAGFALLMLLMIAVTYNDILRLI